MQKKKHHDIGLWESFISTTEYVTKRGEIVLINECQGQNVCQKNMDPFFLWKNLRPFSNFIRPPYF